MKILLLETTFDPRLITISLKSFFDKIKTQDIQIFLFTSQSCWSQIPEELKQKICGVKVFENYYTSALVEWEAIELHVKFPYKKIIALREFDLLRAARIRERLGLSGQDYQTTLIFRDKYLMKQYATQVGIKTCAFAKVDTVSELYNFIKRIGYPIIVKPRLKAGGLGFSILKNSNDVIKYFKVQSKFLEIDTSLGLIAEEYIGCSMVHVDGIFHQGEAICITVAEYMGYKAHHAINDQETYDKSYSGSLRLDENLERTIKLKEFALNLLKLFDKKNTFGFHIELWINKENVILLNEVASRMGGAQVYYLQKALYPTSPEACLFQYACTENADEAFSELKKGSSIYAFSGRIPVRVGHVKKIPDKLSLKNVVFYQPSISEGNHLPPIQTWRDNMGHIVTTGENPFDALKQFECAVIEFNSKCQIEN